MGFQEILGHERQITFLSSAARRGMVHHAYLFAGRPGIGRRTVALTFARALNCERQNGDACDVCASCRKILAGTHPDVQIVGEDRSKPQIVIDDIREKIIRFVSFKVFEGRMRVILLLDAERMNNNTANALLKTLEEPPGQTVFLLTTANLNALLPTIRSRCQKVRFSPIDESRIADHLEQHHQMPPEQARLLARLSEGSIGRALGLTPEQLTTRDTFLGAVLQLGTGPAHDPVTVAEQLAGDKNILTSQLTLLESFLRDAAVLQLAPTAPLRNPDQADVLEKFAARLTVTAIHRLLGLVRDIRGAARLNINPQVALERLFLELAQAQKAVHGTTQSRSG